MKQFELFHLSLVPTPNLFAAATYALPVRSRAEWLADNLASGFAFNHRRKEYFWVPGGFVRGETIFGTVARSRSKVHHKPPSEGAAEILSEEWQGAIVVIDASHHDDGQKVAFERDSLVGATEAVLRSLMEHINARLDAPYRIVAEPIWDKASFWDWSHRHENRVRRITFDFVVPNMWGTATDLDADLRELGEDTGTRTAKVKLESPDGVRTDSQHVREGVDYAARGGGKVDATSLGGAKYHSTDTVRTSSLPEPSDEASGGWAAVRRWVDRILGREQIAPLGDDNSDNDGSSVS